MGELRRPGRPPHPDILTPREWEVLGLLREGLTNRQIGARLGVSHDAAKYHVGQILSKIGVETREEAALWQPQPPQAEAAWRPVWARGLTPLAGLLRRLPLVAKAALVAMSAGVLAGVAMLAYMVVTNGGEDDSGLVGDVTPSPTAETSPGTVVTRTIGEAIDVPEGTVMIMEAGCYGCDGPATGLYRVFRLATGDTVVQQLFSAGRRDYPGNPQTVFEANGVAVPTTRTVEGATNIEEPYISGWGISDDGDTIVASLCVRGWCGGSIAGLASDAQTILYRSTDGGITWDEMATLDAGVWALDVDTQGRALVAEWTSPDPNVPASFFFEPGHEPAIRPDVVPENTFPTLLEGEQLVWGAAGTFYLPDGSVFLSVPGEHAADGVMYGGLTGPVAIQTGEADANLEVYDAKSGSTERFNVPGLWSIAGWAPGPQLFGNIDSADGGGSVPAIIYDKNDFVSPITQPFQAADFERGRNRLLAVQVNPAALVTGNGPGACLDIRADPSTDAESLDCVPDDVIVHVVEPDQGNGWLHVTSPGGAKGYARAEFLAVIALPPSQD